MYMILTLGWKELILGAENWNFLPEVILRTFIMFIIVMISLRLLGKRGVKQLSVFEFVVIISLGSAAGDPMFYKDVGIIPALLVFIIIVALYSLITWFIGKNKRFEKLMEGKPVRLIKNGAFSLEDFSKAAIGENELFAELRVQSISQLGQIEEAIMESSGDLSIFYYPDKDVKFGLPIMPYSLSSRQQNIKEDGYHACVFCGYTEKLKPAAKYTCPKCQKDRWVKASNKTRIR